LQDKIKVSKVYEYRLKSDIKKKLQTFQQLELPLLMKNGFVKQQRRMVLLLLLQPFMLSML
jgi:hypothetical protein